MVPTMFHKSSLGFQKDPSTLPLSQLGITQLKPNWGVRQKNQEVYASHAKSRGEVYDFII